MTTLYADNENIKVSRDKLKVHTKSIEGVDNTLTLAVLYNSESCIEIKINLNFYFHTSLLCRRKVL